MDLKRIWRLTGWLWLLSQIVAFVALEGNYLVPRVCLAVVNGASCLIWLWATNGWKHKESAFRPLLALQLPLSFDTALCFLLAFGGGSGEDADIRSLVIAVLFMTCLYPLVGVATVVVRMTTETGLAATAAVRGAALHAHLQSRGYQWLSLGDGRQLWRLCGEAAFLLPPWEHCGVLPEVNEGDLESLARVAKLRRETHRDARSRSAAFS